MIENIELLVIPGTATLDTVQVYWRNIGPGKGEVTVTCWGSAWTCYFGGMGDKTIQEFVRSCDIGYLVSKLGYTKWLKQRKTHDQYLGRVISAIKGYLSARGEATA